MTVPSTLSAPAVTSVTGVTGLPAVPAGTGQPTPGGATPAATGGPGPSPSVFTTGSINSLGARAVPSANSAAAHVGTSPLTTALQQLTTAIDPDCANKAAGIVLRPEFYCQFKDNNVQIPNLDRCQPGKQRLFS